MENATQIICRCAEDSAKITISGCYIAEHAAFRLPLVIFLLRFGVLLLIVSRMGAIVDFF